MMTWLYQFSTLALVVGVALPVALLSWQGACWFMEWVGLGEALGRSLEEWML